MREIGIIAIIKSRSILNEEKIQLTEKLRPIEEILLKFKKN